MHLRTFPFIGIVVLSLILSACASNTPVPQETPSQPTGAPATQTAEPQPTPTETAVPARTLVVCTQQEPETLYLYGSSSRSMWSVLEAIYDGPFDARGFDFQPVILEKVPSLADGDVSIRPVTVREGDTIVDADGNYVALKAGVKVRPAGCNSPDCATAWDGTSELSMDQLVVNFKLLSGLTWSDGTPLTANDSLYSYQIASDPATPVSRYLTDRTFSYKALDEQSVEWTGLPGFYESRFAAFFWLPLPRHSLGEKSAEALLTDPSATRSPLGWGPYVIQEWTQGDHITLVKNANYFRAAEGLPKFDTLVYRFVGETADGNLNALLAGECDVVDQNEQFLEMVPGLLTRETENKLKLYSGQGPEWEHLDFGIRPVSYDDGYNPGSGDRPDLFGDARTRQAIATCIDRGAIIEQFLYNRSVVSDSFLPPSHPLYQEDLTVYKFDPARGQQLLDEVGWKDTDGDPTTPRVAQGVVNVPDGTPLSFSYMTTQAKLRQQVAEAVANSLRENCGVHADLKFENPGTMFAQGPQGLVFGRQFDMVQFSWEAAARPNCQLFTSTQVPNEANVWTGANITGLNDPAFDAACASAYWSRPTDPDYADRQRQVQQSYVQTLPAIPLYFYPKLAISRADLCGFSLDVTTRSAFWNLEGLDYGGECPEP